MEKGYFDYERFVRKMDELRGGRTVTEFTEICGINRQNYYRLISPSRDGPPPVPTRTILKKIADATGCSYRELLAICGYCVPEKQSRDELTPAERIKACTADIRGGFSEIIKIPKLYASVDDFIMTWIENYAVETCTYNRGEPTPYTGNLHNYAEDYVNIRVIFSTQSCSCTIFAVIYFAQTKGNRWIPLQIGFDGRSILESGGLSVDELKMTNWRYEEIETKNVIAQIQYKTPAERLLDAIFHDNFEDQYPFTVSGIGIDVSTVPVCLDTFMSNHGYSANTKILHGNNPYGYAYAIADIMASESGFPFAVHISDDIDGKITVAIIVDYYKLSDMSSVEMISRKYAKELGLRGYGEQIIFTHRIRDRQAMHHL